MRLIDTCFNKLSKFIPPNTLRFEFDCRYLNRWIKEYPQCFPSFVVRGNYSIVFTSLKLRYELWKI